MHLKVSVLTLYVSASLMIVTLCGCSQPAPVEETQSEDTDSQGSVLAHLRPKADPKILARVQEETPEDKLLESPDEEIVAAAGNSQRKLPEVVNTPFAPPAEQVANPVQPMGAQPAVPFFPFAMPGQGTPESTDGKKVASYGGYGDSTIPPPPPSPAGGLVPPPPAISLSTQAQTMPYGAPPEAYMNPYANPYLNPYANPYANSYAGQAPATDSRPAGSPFSSGGQGNASSDDDRPHKSRPKDFTPIIPTGMESRSAAKQREDLRVLLKGALVSSPILNAAGKDKDVAVVFSKLDVGMPGESSKGNLSLPQRSVDQLFRPAPLDKKLAFQLRKTQGDMAQAYYRLLYAYNKFALAQQTVAARKQEVEVAESASEQQRAAADLASSQNESESTRDDWKSAQNELAAVSGAQAARSIIARVSGVAPAIDGLVAAERQAQAQSAKEMGSSSGGILGLLGFGKSHEEEELVAQPKALKAPQESKPRDSKKANKGKPAPGDLVQAPTTPASKVATAPAPEVKVASYNPIAFELKNVNVLPRKSVLRVAIRNNGSDSFAFNPDVITITEGNRKLSDAAVRADFDTTLISPSSEVSGTITIFGYPWNERLSVYISDNSGHNIPLKR